MLADSYKKIQRIKDNNCKSNRIIILSSYYPPHFSGPSKQAHQINKILTKQGISIRVITQKKEKFEINNVDGINILRLPFKGLGSDFRTKKGLFIWSILTALYLIKNRNEFEIMHVLDSYFSSAIFTLIGLFLRKPVIVKNSIARGAINNYTKIQKIRLFILKKKAKMIAISKETYNELINHGFLGKNIFFIPNSVDIELFCPVIDYNEKKEIRETLGLDKNCHYVIYVGLLNRRKGIDKLLQSWMKIIKERSDLQLLLIGDFDNKTFKEWAEDYISKNVLFNHIKLIGYKNNTTQYLKASDIFVFPSEREGLPNALMEAMSTGLPCLARPIGGVTDLIDDKTNGILCDGEGDVLIENLKEGILLLLDNNNYALKLGKNARRKIEDKYGMEKISKKYFNLYYSGY